MKKSFIIILFLSASSLISKAQFPVITPKIGLTLSTSQDLAQLDFTPAYLLGVTVTYKLFPKLSLAPGILFEQKRATLHLPYQDSNGTTIAASEKINYNYLSLPVLLEFHPFRKDHIFINGGMYTGYLMNAKAKITLTNNGENSDIKEDVQINNFKRLVFGLGIGGGINIPVKKNGQILIDLQYEHTLSQGVQFLDLQFRTFTFSAGYGIRIGK